VTQTWKDRSLPFDAQIRAWITAFKDGKSIELWEGRIKLIEDVVAAEGDGITNPEGPNTAKIPLVALVVELFEVSTSPEGEKSRDALLQCCLISRIERRSPIEVHQVGTPQELGAIGSPNLFLLSGINTGPWLWSFRLWHETCGC
jgi:hypothetical protein